MAAGGVTPASHPPPLPPPHPSHSPHPPPTSVIPSLFTSYTDSTSYKSPPLVDINWTMLDKSKFLPYSVVCSFSVRAIIYPLSVIKTRLQVQRHLSLYSGTFDAFLKTFKYEGMRGLYKGFWINSTQAVSGIFYILTYETARHLVTTYTPVSDRKIGSLVGGAAASMVGITIINPVDVVTQHMMLHGQHIPTGMTKKVMVEKLDYSSYLTRSRLGVAGAVTTAVYKNYGLKGFYKGYFAALMLYSPNSAIWWFTYQHYTDLLSHLTPSWVPLSLIQCVSAPASGATAALITNPLDIIRVRLQVEGKYSFLVTSRALWREERLNMFLKGLSARMPLSMIFSFLIATGYEAIKRLSVKEEYRHHVHW